MTLARWWRRLPASRQVSKKSVTRGSRLVVEVLEERTLLSAAAIQQTALDAYVAAPDPSYHYSLNSTLTGTGYTDYVINMTSQTWRSAAEVDRPVWQHWLQILVPSTVTSSTAVLDITGGFNSSTAPSTPDALGVLSATSLGAITVVLPTVPNEPLTFTGDTGPRIEDQIIAYTLNQYLNGGDSNWPLLLPMVKSAVRAMDTAQSFVAAQSGGSLGINDFIVTGASKRGWTTWLTPAVDSRIRAIVPFVFDALNLNAQVPHENDVYANVTQDVVGGFSSALQDYTNFNIFGRFNTPQGVALGQIIDPFAYISRPTYNIPKYLVDSTGDQFFAPDSSQFYFSSLPGQNYIRYVPNTAHGLNSDAVSGAINFERVLLDGAALPRFSWSLAGGGATINVTTLDAPITVKMWQATNLLNRDFRLETFGPNWTSSTLLDQSGGHYVAHVGTPATGATAFMVELTYMVDGLPLTFTTQVSEVPHFMPTVVTMDAGGTYSGKPFPATATAVGVAGHSVAGSFRFFYYTGSSAQGVSFSTPPTRAGIYTVVASFTSADPNYQNGASAPVTFTIAQATPTIVVRALGGTYDGKPFAATAKATGVNGAQVPGTFTFTYYAGSTVSGPGSAQAPTDPGTYTVVASFTSAGINYSNAQSNPVTFTIAFSNLSLYDGSYTGSYSGTSVVNNQGVITATPVPDTALQASIATGVLLINTPQGNGSGTVNSKGYITGITTIQAEGIPIPVRFTGQVTVVDGSGTSATGVWTYSKNLGNGIVLSGHGTWSMHGAQVLTDFDGNYAGISFGKITQTKNGVSSTIIVDPAPFTSTIFHGVLIPFFANPELSNGQGTIDVNGNVTGTVPYVYEGVPVTIHFSGGATRSLTGVHAEGTWDFTAQLSDGTLVNGQGSWSSDKVLLFNGSYAGSFHGKVIVNNQGTVTVEPIPGALLSNTKLQLAISNGSVTLTVPGIPAAGTGTIDAHGNVTGSVAYQDEGQTITVTFVGAAIQMPAGTCIRGMWSFTHDFGNGVTEMGNGEWMVSEPGRL